MQGEFRSNHSDELENFLWSLVWLHLDAFTKVYSECTKLICQFGWQLLILHESNPRLHACFDKVKNGPTCTI